VESEKAGKKRKVLRGGPSFRAQAHRHATPNAGSRSRTQFRVEGTRGYAVALGRESKGLFLRVARTGLAATADLAVGIGTAAVAVLRAAEVVAARRTGAARAIGRARGRGCGR